MMPVIADMAAHIRRKHCDACDGLGWITVEGPDYLGRDGNCWRGCWDEACPECGGDGWTEIEDSTDA